MALGVCAVWASRVAIIMSMIVRDEEDGHLVALSLHGPLEVACGIVPVLTVSLAVWVSVPPFCVLTLWWPPLALSNQL